MPAKPQGPVGKGKSFQLLVQPHYGKQPSHSVESQRAKRAAWHSGGGFLFFSCSGFRSGAVVQPCSHSGSPLFLLSKLPVTRKCHQPTLSHRDPGPKEA